MIVLSIRDEALINDYQMLLSLQFTDKRIKLLEKSGNPPETYRIQLNCKAIEYVDHNESPIYRYRHVIRISNFPEEYPTTPGKIPTAYVEPIDDKYIYHPNIQQSNGYICLDGGENDSETLASLVLRIIDMIQYRNMNFGSPYGGKDGQYVTWVRNNINLFPLTDDFSGNISNSSVTSKTIKWGR
jgi:ubiquitin-protein ligase